MANKVGAESDEQMKQELVPKDDAQISSESSETTVDLEKSQTATEDAPPSKQKSLLRSYEAKYQQLQEFLTKHMKLIRLVILFTLLAGYFCAVIAACVLNFKRAVGLLVLTLLAVFFICWDWLMARYGGTVSDNVASRCTIFKTYKVPLKLGLYIAMVTFTVLWLALDTWKEGADQIISFFGLCMLVILTFIFSKYPGKVKWRTVFWGIGLQFILALSILRTHTGFVAVNWLGIQVQIFMNYVDAGAKFLFGEKYTDHYFAFKVLPLVIYFSSVISILYHLGFIQWLIMKIGWLMQVTMGTSPTESLVAASNMFVGQTESPLMIRPYLKDLTLSEMHSVMCSGFATIAGSVLGAYISFGVPAAHLLTASVMSAPAALAIGKLFWPETEKAKITVNTNIKFDKSEASNVIEAACLGAGAAIPLVANIAANLIAFLSLLSFLNATLSWVGHMFNEPDLNFELICSYVFMPLAFMMGVDWTDSFLVAELLGIKTFFNEFVAYLKLAELIKRRKDGLPEFIGNRKQYLSVRSETIATYALCGFANIGSVGIVIGGLSSIAPTRFRDIASVSLRALIAGTVACFMTACVAGILYRAPKDIYSVCPLFLENSFNTSTLPIKSVLLKGCCLNLFTSTVVQNSIVIAVEGQYPYSTSSVADCCVMMNSPTFDCNQIKF